MEDFHPSQDGAMEPVDFSDHHTYSFRLSSRDLLQFGQLFLQQGRWDSRQVIPAHWVQSSTLPVSHASYRGVNSAMWWVTHDGVAWSGVILPKGDYSAYDAMGSAVLAETGMSDRLDIIEGPQGFTNCMRVNSLSNGLSILFPPSM